MSRQHQVYINTRGFYRRYMFRTVTVTKTVHVHRKLEKIRRLLTMCSVCVVKHCVVQVVCTIVSGVCVTCCVLSYAVVSHVLLLQHRVLVTKLEVIVNVVE